MAINSNSNLTNSYVDAISLRTSELLAGNFILSSILAPLQDLRPNGIGDSVRVLRDPKGTVRDVADDTSTANSFDTPTQLYDTVTLNYYRTVEFGWGQKDQIIANPEITINRYASAGEKQISGDITAKTLLDIANDPDVPAGNEIGAVGTAMNIKALSEIDKRFFDNGTAEGDRYLLLSSKHYQDLINNTTLQSSDFVPVGAVESGVLAAKLFGLTIFRTQYLATNDNLSSVTGTDTNQVSLAFDRSAIGFTMSPIIAPDASNIDFSSEVVNGFTVGVYRSFDFSKRLNVLGMDALYGVKVFSNPSLHSTNPVVNVFPVLGGVA
jgi:hypothetical protein